jgi:hypothetical protein
MKYKMKVICYKITGFFMFNYRTNTTNKIALDKMLDTNYFLSFQIFAQKNNLHEHSPII